MSLCWRSRTKISEFEFESPRTKLLARDAKAINLPSVDKTGDTEESSTSEPSYDLYIISGGV